MTAFYSRIYSKLALIIPMAMIAIGSVFLTSAALNAGGVSTALYSLQNTVTNSGSIDLDDIQVPIALSGGALISGNFIKTDALNTIVHKGSVDVPAMPATDAIQVEGAVQQDGAAYTEYTTAAQNPTLNDLPLLPSTPAVDDAWYTGCDNPCRIITTEIDTAGAGTWTITYEYWDGTQYTALANVDDRTSGFTALGRHSATWDMPSDWATRTVTGSSVEAYWARARVSAFSSITTQPLGSTQDYENGQWWTWVEDLDVNTQEQVTLYLGGATDLVEYHQTFPGTAGITTGDDATLELGTTYSVAIKGRLDFSAAGASTYLMHKTGAVTVNVSGSAVSPVIGTSITGGGSGDSDVLTIPATGEQTVVLASDGTSAATFVSDGGGMLSYDVVSVPDTGNNITWASGGGTNYFEFIMLDTAAPTIFDFEKSQADFAEGTLINTVAYTSGLGLAN